MSIWMSCVDRVDLSLPASELPLIIDGMITDQPGPYAVRLSRAFPVDGVGHSYNGVTGAVVAIADNTGAVDTLTEFSPGYYLTTFLQGVVGRTYQLKVTTESGMNLESTLETMPPAGTIDSLYVDYTSRENSEGVLEEGFNVYLDATAAAGSSLRIRWKFNGTYQVTTNPSTLTTSTVDPVSGLLVTGPLPCAASCECCTCWVPEKEKAPLLANNTFLGATHVNGIFIRYIPITDYTFNNMYHVEITQMEVSQPVYDFYKAVEGQVDNANSLFQPPFFELKGNITPTNSSSLVVGVFSAVALTKKSIFIDKTDIPHAFIAPEIVADCRSVAFGSSTTKPPFWP